MAAGRFTALAYRYGACTVCGKKGQRKKTFTVSAKDVEGGSMMSNSELQRMVDAQARQWGLGPMTHPACEKGK